MRKRKIWSLYGASTHLEVIINEIILDQLYWIHNAMQDIIGNSKYTLHMFKMLADCISRYYELR